MMHSPNSSCNNNQEQEPILNYMTLFPENDTTSFFPNFPHIHLEYEDAYLQFLHLFYQHQSISNAPDHHNDHQVSADGSKPDHHNQPIIITATSTMSKKDRHSKIHTARGPRDRRMRLSLDIARRFFHLQDLLGYDKASRTIEWLLRNAGPAITELARGRGFSVPTSESSTCEQANEIAVSSKESRIRRSKKVKRTTVERESRRKARERARERTSQKRRLITTVQEDLPLGLISTHSSLKGSMDLSSHYQQLCSTSLPWNPSTLFNFQDEQIAEFDFSGKPWEDFNSFNLSG